MKRINTPEELVQACSTEEYRDFCIGLAGGTVLRSSKQIKLRENRKSFYVYNEVDGTSQVLNFTSLFTRSNIGMAMGAHSFFRV